MGLRRAAAYSKRKARPFTRISSVQSKAYIKTVPPQKIVKFSMGDLKAYESGKFKFVLKLVSNERVRVQMRDNAIESARQALNKNLETSFPGMHYFAIKVFPHHILRENKQLAGAGADRMQKGMQLSFGANIGRAAMVKPGKEIFVVAVENEKNARLVKQFFRPIKAKLPCKTRIVWERR